MTNPKVVSKEDIKEFRSNFESNDKNLFAQNVVHEHGPSKACLNPKAKLAISDNVFSHTIGDFFFWYRPRILWSLLDFCWSQCHEDAFKEGQEFDRI